MQNRVMIKSEIADKHNVSRSTITRLISGDISTVRGPLALDVAKHAGGAAVDYLSTRLDAEYLSRTELKRRYKGSDYTTHSR